MSTNTLPRRVEVRAPATVANLGAGFDILGMALETPYDVIIAERTDIPGVQIKSISGDGGKLPLEPAKNTAGIAAQAVLDQLGIKDTGACLTLHKGLPLASGLGSSAASAAGGAAAVNALYGSKLSPEDLIPAAVEGEAAVSGRHADNVAPALMGGIVLVTGVRPDQCYRLPTPPNLWLTIVTPEVAVPTKEARAVLPNQIALGTMVKQTASAALLIHALHSGDLRLLGQAVEGDGVIEPARAHLMPGLEAIRAASRERGALATIISGAGPTLCAFSASKSTADRVLEGMFHVFYEMGIGFSTQVSRPSTQGVAVKVLE